MCSETSSLCSDSSLEVSIASDDRGLSSLSVKANDDRAKELLAFKISRLMNNQKNTRESINKNDSVI